MEKIASVTKLKASLSAFMDSVKAGEEITVTERGRVIAKLVPYASQDNESLSRLIRKGSVRPPTGPSLSSFLAANEPLSCQGSLVEELLAERELGY